jgi:hypothetical protein
LGKGKDNPLLQEELSKQGVIIRIDLGDDIGLIIFQGSQPGKVEDKGEVESGGSSSQEKKEQNKDQNQGFPPDTRLFLLAIGFRFAHGFEVFILFQLSPL